MIMNFYLLNDLTVSPLCGANFGNSYYGILGSVIGAVGSIAGGLIGGSSSANSVKNTNATNYKIAQEYNANQIRLAEMQNQWNVEQRDFMNNYNSPIQQMKRFRAAGINPYMALSNINSGNQDSALSAVQPQQQAPPSMIAPSYDYIGKSVESGIGAAASLAQAAYANAETKGKNIENVYNNDVLEARIKKYFNETKLSDFDAKLRAHTYLNEVQLSDLNVQMQKQELLNARATQFNIEADTHYKNALKGLTETQSDKLNYEITFKMPYEVANLQKEGKLLDQKAMTEITNRMLMRANINLMSQQAEEIRKMLPLRLAGQRASNASAWLAFDYSYDDYENRLYQSQGEANRSWYYEYQTPNFKTQRTYSTERLKPAELKSKGTKRSRYSYSNRQYAQ